MKDLITNVITFILSNFTLTFLFLGLVASLISLAFKKKPLEKKQVVEAFLSYFILFNFGIGYIYNFIMHVFFAEMAASFIGWQNSPFQYEVGFASLGFGIVGIIAFRQKQGFRVAAVTGPSFFLWGAAGGHIYQMVSAGNFSPGNAGVIFWTDLFLPVIGFVLLLKKYRLEKVNIVSDDIQEST